MGLHLLVSQCAFSSPRHFSHLYLYLTFLKVIEHYLDNSLWSFNICLLKSELVYFVVFFVFFPSLLEGMVIILLKMYCMCDQSSAQYLQVVYLYNWEL